MSVEFMAAFAFGYCLSDLGISIYKGIRRWYEVNLMDIVTTIVIGLMQIAPDVCQINLLNPDFTLYTFRTKCSI